MSASIFTDSEQKAADHISKQCASTHAAALSYRAFMQAVKLRMELQGWTPPPKSKAKP